MYDLRVVVEEVRGFCDLPMNPGDYFEVKGGRIIVPPARILVNDRVCSGCRACELACAFAHEGLFGETYARVRVEKDEPAGLDRPRICRQCGTARCVEACPKRALSRHPETHAVLVDYDLCTGCGLCAEACPFGAVHFHPETGKALICDLCGGSPECVRRCATGALKFGNAGSYISGPGREGRY